MTGYEAFGLYNAIKLHFTTDSYDFHKYNGKTHVTVDSFEKRKDKYYFYKLSRKYPSRDSLISFLVSNFMHGGNNWVGDLLDADAENNFLDHQKFLQSVSYIFENDCKTVFGGFENPDEALYTDGEYPVLLNLAFQKEIHFESLCILNMILGFVPVWKKRITDNIRWPIYCKMIEKTSCFLPQDMVKYKTILKKVVL